ncbi:DUF6439 family protein [Prochlorococcus sp. MIT 1341]|uniref:DUF6439 family protein n=1 Tax=Prochlorococcus sp. MIT 1341 TaxID=3096221 RepID=UPI002A749CE8|nr:DUF6439 family protein [Prochlorococcus sp. MIT 1341]
MTKQKWSTKTKDLAKELHSELTLNHKNWHQLKSDSDCRAAELLSGALLQLLQQGKRSDVEALSIQAIKWLKGELKDPGCPHR